MPSTVPYLTGPDLTDVRVIAQVRDFDGVLTPAVTYNVSTLTTELGFTGDPTHEDIGPVNISGANNVITTDDSTLNLTVLLVRNTFNPLTLAFGNYDFFRVLWTRGSESFDYYCTRGSFGDAVESRGANFQRTTFRRIQIGTANPLLS